VTTQIGPFEFVDPLPTLREPRMLVALQPWIDVGSVGTMSLAYVGDALGAQPLGQLTKPGRFFDFTRYRPVLTRQDGKRIVTVPNSRMHFSQGRDHDWVLLHSLEPHANGDEFVEGLIEAVLRLGVKEYTLVGSMYAPVPHTRRPVASGGSSNEEMRRRLLKLGVRESNYEGPTTIMAIMGATGPGEGIDTSTVILQLPAYAQVERDYMGLEAMLDILAALYGFELEMAPVRHEAEQQRLAMDETANEDPRLQVWLRELEQVYDAESKAMASPDEMVEGESPQLSPELEKFLREVEGRWHES